jgi:hypothetical protein
MNGKERDEVPVVWLGDSLDVLRDFSFGCESRFRAGFAAAADGRSAPRFCVDGAAATRGIRIAD